MNELRNEYSFMNKIHLEYINFKVHIPRNEIITYIGNKGLNK